MGDWLSNVGNVINDIFGNGGWGDTAINTYNSVVGTVANNSQNQISTAPNLYNQPIPQAIPGGFSMDNSIMTMIGLGIGGLVLLKVLKII